MKQPKRNALWRCAAFVVFSLLPAVQLASAQTKVSIIHIVIGAVQVPLWIAHEQGLFAKQGIDAQIIAEEGPVSRRITGDIPFGVLGLPAVIDAVAAEGRDLRVIAALDTGRTISHLMARPELKTPADLRGKRIGVTRIGFGFWITAMLALEQLGLDPKRDGISFVELGGAAPQLVQGLEAGAVDAVMLDPGQSSQLKTKGFSLLLDMAPANVSASQNVLAVHGAYLREHPDVVEKVVAGLVEGIGFSLSPANKETVLKTLTARLKISVPTAAESGYQAFLARVSRKPYPSAQAIANLRRVMARNDPRVLNVKMEDLIVDRFVRKLDESGVIDRFYSTYGVK